jgi:hypothetical protein
MTTTRRNGNGNRIHPVTMLILLGVLALLSENKLHPIDPHSNDNNSIASTVQFKASKRRRSNNQKIIILPGPHKTGSTSVQAALFQWTEQRMTTTTFNSTNHSSSIDLFTDWAYPVPTAQDFESIQSSYGTKLVGGKGFSRMVTRLFANPSQTPEEIIQSSSLLRLYRQKIQQAWDEGYNLVIASEHLDRLVVESYAAVKNNHLVSPDQLWERFSRLLPPSANVIIGIQHRTPRIDHLTSLWHHLGKKDESLLDYVTKPTKPGLFSVASSLNSLGLADFFAQRGHVVRILDTGSLPSLLLKTATAAIPPTVLDLPIAVACHVVQVSTNIRYCIDSLGGPHYKNNNTKYYNQRSDPGVRGIDSRTLQAIDRLLMDYDCQLYHDLLLEAKGRNMVEWIGGGVVDQGGGDPWLFASKNCPFSSKSTNKKLGMKTKRPSFSDTVRAIVDLVCRKYPTAKHCRSRNQTDKKL